MLSSVVAGIDPHQATFTVAVVDSNGVEIAHDTFSNSATGYLTAIELLNTHRVERVAVEGRRVGDHMLRSRSPGPGSMHVRCRRNALLSNVGRGGLNHAGIGGGSCP
jgi:hypothetical protein